MLSRVAESLFWMARYVERAEAVSRLVAVSYQARLDGVEPGAWADMARMSTEDALVEGLCGGDEESVLRFLLAHPMNPNAVLTCLARARENARAARDQISGEMWEQLNRLYLLARSGDSDDPAQAPYAFFLQVRDGSQALDGITSATMTHGEAYHFIQLGRHLERATSTVRTLRVRHERVSALTDGTAASSLALMTLLKACGAFEPFRRQGGSQLQAGRVAQYLLLDPLFPRSLLFCLDRCAAALAAAAPGRDGERLDTPVRLLGRLRADLAYLDADEVVGPGLTRFLEDLLRRIHRIGDEVTRTYFNTRVILPAPRGSRAAQQQQQQ
jgi:uncharacterized alpha-E superfamily protein